MPFCPNCGTQQQSGVARFCSNCGYSASTSGQVTQLKQPFAEQMQTQPTRQIPKVIGILKEMEPNEKVIYQGVTQTEVIFVKEAEIKKVIGRERKEVPISISSSFIFLTNQRLVFLKLFELSAAELEDKNNLLAGAAGTFYEVPINAVSSVDMRVVNLNKNDEQRFRDFFGESNEYRLKKPALEIIYDEKAAAGRAKDYMEAMLQRGALSKLWGKVEMTYDKIFVLGEQTVAIQPTLSERVKQKIADK